MITAISYTGHVIIICRGHMAMFHYNGNNRKPWFNCDLWCFLNIYCHFRVLCRLSWLIPLYASAQVNNGLNINYQSIVASRLETRLSVPHVAIHGMALVFCFSSAILCSRGSLHVWRWSLSGATHYMSSKRTSSAYIPVLQGTLVTLDCLLWNARLGMQYVYCVTTWPVFQGVNCV